MRSRSKKTKFRLQGFGLLAGIVFALATGAEALTINVNALEAAMTKLDIETEISSIENSFRLFLSTALSRQEFPTIRDINRLSIDSERDKKEFDRIARMVVPNLPEGWIDNVEEILWAVPTKNGIVMCEPKQMSTIDAVSATVVVKYVPLKKFKNNKFGIIALNSIKKNRIITEEGGNLVVWIMPRVSETQALIEETAKIILQLKGETKQ